MWCARALALLAVAALAHATTDQRRLDGGAPEILFDVSDEEYYRMPALFALDDFDACLARGGAFCLGSFELSPPATAEDPPRSLFRFMQGVSANWVDNFNHTRLHRGLCLQHSCRDVSSHAAGNYAVGDYAVGLDDGNLSHYEYEQRPLDAWFASCVNASTRASHGLSARLYRLEYCARNQDISHVQPLSANERAFAALLAALLAAATVSTVLDLTLRDQLAKKYTWALAWSLPACWRALHASPGGGGGGGGAGRGRTDLRALDGLRVMCMMCVIVEHVCWLATQSFLADTRQYELMRGATDVMLMVNSTLVVQIFFLMSSFLLAHKLLQQRRRSSAPEDWRSALTTFTSTMFNRIIRISPSYFFVVWFAASWWARLGRGPQWGPWVGGEAAVCRHKWWAHLLYLNNVVYPDDKCLIQTWYLAADMQLYAWCLALTLVVRRWQRAALALLAALLLAAVALLAALAYSWRLVPTFVMHSPELVRAVYRGEASFNVLYQSPLANAPGALAGLLLAHLHHYLLDAKIDLSQSKAFRWVSVASPLLALAWAALSPRLTGRGPPDRWAAAALAATERPIFALFVSLGLLGAMHGVDSPLRRVLGWRTWRTPARLSFGALLLHLPLDKARRAMNIAPIQVTRANVFVEWFGVALVSYACALPLALLVELPAQRLHQALSAPPASARAPSPPPPDKPLNPHVEKTTM